MADKRVESHLVAFIKELKEAGNSHVSMATLIAKCDQSVIAPFLLALSLLTFIPLIATPAGLLSSLFYWHLLTAKTLSPISWLGRQLISLELVTKAVGCFIRIENLLGPYIPALWQQLCFKPALFNLHCCYGLICSFGVIVPIPGINYLFGPSLLLLSLALVHANGLLALLTYVLLPIQSAALFFAIRKIIALFH